MLYDVVVVLGLDVDVGNGVDVWLVLEWRGGDEE